jgi:Ca2+-binding RTX toxin-like protein
MARYRFSLIDPVVVNTTTAGNQVDPRVGFRAEVGGLGIVWESQEPTGDVIRGRVIFPASSQDADTVVSDGVGEDESLPNFAQNGTLAIWNSGTSIKAATLPISGGVQPSFVLNTTPGGVISRSEILRLADGTYLAVYFTQSGDDGSSYSLRVERFSASGESYSPEILVPEKFTGAQEAPSVVQLANGNVVITWASEADELGNFEVKQRLLDIYGPEVGDSGDNVLTGTPDSNLFLLHQGGEDTASGLAGNDNFYFGAELSAGDMVDGGEGTLDQLGLQGNYGTFGAGASPFTLGSNHLVNVEMLVLLSGSDSRFGDSAGNFYSYNIATLDGHVAAGQQLVVSFNTLRSGENVTFDGSAETNGSFMTYGGLGTDILTGGQQSDSFYFGADGRFGAGDRVDGRGGSLDQLGLQGDYSGARAVTFAADSMTSIEMIVLLGAGDARFGGGSADGFSYDIVMNDANVAEGSRMYISANTLRSDHLFNETLDFDGSAEKDGFFTIYAGAGADTLVGGERSDEIWGRGGADRITGGLGADVLRGGAGNDVFAYDSIAHSSAVSSDRIMDFATGDVIALSTIDANGGTADDDAFVFIGSAAFTMGTAGQLRAYEDSAQAGHWFVEADVNGDGEADLVIEVFTTDLQPLDAADFVL